MSNLARATLVLDLSSIARGESSSAAAAVVSRGQNEAQSQLIDSNHLSSLQIIPFVHPLSLTTFSSRTNEQRAV